MACGTLRIYLGAAPGVGKTYARLGEAHRRKSRGTDVVVGFVETHGRARTRSMIGDLEVVPRRIIDYRGTTFEEMDVDAVIARRPHVVCVDELAHTNVPGCAHEKRWQDIESLLAAGITVLSTVNIQHLESVNDVVEKITGIRQRETVPDAFVRAADQVEVVDITPEALRRRMAHGNIYAADKIDAAMANYFRVGNLSALRELAAVAGRQGRRVIAEISPRPSHRRDMGDPRAGRSRAHRWAGRGDVDPAGSAHRHPRWRRPSRRARRPFGRARRRQPSPSRRTASAA